MILETMLQRLFASLVHGPSMNARPHRSRQRSDWMDLGFLQSLEPAGALKVLMEKRKIDFPAKVPSFQTPAYPESEWSDEQRKARDAFVKQTKLLKKLRDIAEDARDYMNDHGDSCLALGFPLISIPPHGGDDSSTRGSSRVLAPLLLLPVELQVRTESRPGVTISATGEGADLLVANPSLIAWLERQTGKAMGELFLDEEATDPWREVTDLLTQLNGLLELDPAPVFGAETLLDAVPVAEKLPKGTCVLNAAVLGLFPLSNQALLKDTRWMQENEATLKEPVSAFLNPKALHDDDAKEDEGEPELKVEITKRNFQAEWLVSSADPCQANAVLSAREAKALVVHGPPGTGKSQTITNMVADHLARGERVLFVCDKRTALDVVKYRLDAVGLGGLCGVVHDPSGDRKDFYMGLREELEKLADLPLPMDPRPQLESVNGQLSAVHSELERYRRKLHVNPSASAQSFHELLGSWLGYVTRTDLPEIGSIAGITQAQVENSRTLLDEISRRAERSVYAANPFRGVLGISLTDFMARNGSDIQATLQALNEAAVSADEVKPAGAHGLEAGRSLVEQAEQRRNVAAILRELAQVSDLSFAKAAATLPADQRSGLANDKVAAQGWANELKAIPLDRSLLVSGRSAGVLNLTQANQAIAALMAWEAVVGSFFKKLFAGAAKKAAHAALAPLGLTAESGWQQGLAFYRGIKTRLLLHEFLDRIAPANSATLHEDAVLEGRFKALGLTWDAQDVLKGFGRDGSFAEIVVEAERIKDFADALQEAAVWADAVNHVAVLVGQSGLFKRDAVPGLIQDWLGETAAAETTVAWLTHGSSLEDVVRLQAAIGQLPAPMQGATDGLAVQGAAAEEMLACFLKCAAENELRGRLQGDSELAMIDGDRIEAAFSSFLTLAMQKQQLVREYIRFLWISHQKSRLLATTGNQLNKHGAALRQRLFVRGKKALKLRQMLATGADQEGGDPLYDLCPVWMASPSTVAQIFPRQAIFDVVIFDEASQCRLEEALPVLLRGHRVVIAGDQKQLPPTRFFESALADSGDSDAETAEELFYQQQQEAEDLLSAALNLDVREAYLDVHYRSRNEALIGFSNEQYYGSRLQPIPGHPRNKALDTPIQLHRVEGVYLERANVKEAEAAVALVAELLAEESPPSIGLACFNLTQRDAILDALLEKAETDALFGQRLAVARQRRGKDSFEGLFVKNLENVQGDERDVMIICTTFGPDAQGKFRRNFGALSQREGGRRLNVLVTRARDAVHVFTSIPSGEYRAVEPTPPGQTPNGRLQLYAYLRYTEKLAELYSEYQNDLEKMRRDSKPEVKKWETATPSRLAAALGDALLAKYQTGSQVFWGNEGFCVDVACIHPIMPADVTVGVLADFSRFHKTPDPIEWDLFRTTVLRGQGWELERVWSPVLFRRLDEMMQRIKSSHDRLSVPAAASVAVKVEQ